jgi:hypothetical protein
LFEQEAEVRLGHLKRKEDKELLPQKIAMIAEKKAGVNSAPQFWGLGLEGQASTF